MATRPRNLAPTRSTAALASTRSSTSLAPTRFVMVERESGWGRDRGARSAHHPAPPFSRPYESILSLPPTIRFHTSNRRMGTNASFDEKIKETLKKAISPIWSSSPGTTSLFRLNRSAISRWSSLCLTAGLSLNAPQVKPSRPGKLRGSPLSRISGRRKRFSPLTRPCDPPHKAVTLLYATCGCACM